MYDNGRIMSTASDISALYGEHTDALTEVLAENTAGPARLDNFNN